MRATPGAPAVTLLPSRAGVGARGPGSGTGRPSRPGPVPWSATTSDRHSMFGSNQFRVRASRVVRDALGGVVWRVVEVDTTGLPGTRGDACLLFDGGQGVRRVWNYPAAWDRLSDADLIALSWAT